MSRSVDSDPSEPLGNSKLEQFVQNRALGHSWKEAYEGAGYRSKSPSKDAMRAIERSDAARARLQWLTRDRWERGVVQGEKLISRDYIIDELKENIREAKRGKPVRVGDSVEWVRDFGAITASLKLGADIGGHIVRRSETKTTQGDPLDGASREELIEMMSGIAVELGGSVDVEQLRGAFGEREVSDGATASDRSEPSEGEDAEASVLQTVPEADGAPSGGGGFSDSVADGGQPVGEDGERLGGSSDARDGPLPGLVGRSSV